MQIKFTGVKEASERAILKLRTLQNQYVSAVRKASNSGEKHPDTKIFRSSDLLHPFLLAANYPNASQKLLDTSFKAMKTLMEADAIMPGDGMNMVRVWMIQAQVVVSYSTTKDSSTSGSAALNSGGGGLKAGISSNATTTSTTINATTTTTTTTKESATTQPTAAIQKTTSGSSSWFGGYFSSGSTSNSNSTTTGPTTNSMGGEMKMTNVLTAKSAVSSSHGQAGSGHLNAKDLEKLALDILSCLLQLLELRDLPVSNDQWIQSVTLCCLLYLPLRQNVRQAAHSTLPQVLTLLVKDKDANQLAKKTWDDLLTCALGFSSSSTKGATTNNNGGNSEKRVSLQGAFSHCRLGEKDAAQPPSPSLSLELMATILTESPAIFSGVGQKTFSVIVQVLHNQSKLNSNALPLEYLRALQFALMVLQTQGTEWPAECRELIARLIQPITMATEALRKQADFEDGYVYSTPNKQLPSNSTSSSSKKIETLQNLPPTVLWNAALAMETLKTFVQDKANKDLWIHEDVVGHLLEATSDFCTIGASCEEHMNLLVRASRSQGEGSTSLAYMAESLDSIERWRKGKSNADIYVLGDALWAGLIALLKMIDQLEESVLEQSFAPSLSVLQHYLKRFPANGTIVQRSLEGYFSLAKVSLNVPLLRRALMASLCKLSLPQWGSNDSSSLLKDHNIAALICMLNVVHRYHNQIGPEWSLVLQTFEELSTMAIASPHLSNNAYVGALSISAVYARLASFSTTLSDKSLLHFLSALKEVSVSEKSMSVTPSPVGGAAIRKPETNKDSQDEKATIGGKLMEIGARAIAWNTDGNAQQEDVPVAERTKNSYYDDYQIEFVNRLATSKHPIRNREVPFSMALMADVAMSNAFRHGQSASKVLETLCDLSSEVPTARMFFMDMVAMMIMSHASEESSTPSSFIGPGKIMYSDPRQNQYLAVEKNAVDDSPKLSVSQVDLLEPLCECIKKASVADSAEAGLEALYSILESTGHNLKSDPWKQVIEAIASVPSAEHSSANWVDSCQLGFRCLKLIVDDFLEDAAVAARASLLDCCSTFGSSRQDVNTSLTAIGLLWTIADQDLGTESVERALAKLVLLSADTRPEVRNCSVNTLFSCIVGRGPTFTEAQWESCICTTIFGVYDAVTSDNENIVDTSSNETGKKKSRYQVNVHHSRDSADKQWLATQALVLRGLCRLLRNFFSALLKTTDDGTGSVRGGEDDTPWFDKAWNKILGYSYEASTQVGGRDTLELRTAGVELLVLCNQLACTAGIHAAITPARVGTNMEVVNGALRSVRTPDRPGNESPLRHSHSAVMEMWRENLFLDAFDVLDSLREHLESDTVGSESGLSPHLEPTQVQVLSKLAVELQKLYDCCKDNEFAEDLSLPKYKSYLSLIGPVAPAPREDDTMIARFVRVVSAVALNSSSGPDSRFLSQAQRSCMDLLKGMTSNGSLEAFLNLIVIAGPSFFAEREQSGKPKKGVDILCHESTNIILDEFSSKALTQICKVIILSRLLSIFLEDENIHDKKKKKSDINDFEISYKTLIPIMEGGLTSAKSLDHGPQETSESVFELLDLLWGRTFLIFSRMLSPTPNGSKRIDISHAPDLVELVNASSRNVPSRHLSDLSSVFVAGAARCLEVAKLIEASGDNVEGTLDLFSACFSGACSHDETMQSIAQKVLAQAADTLTSQTAKPDLNVKAALKICQVLIQMDSIETAVIALFPQLSRLVGVEEPSIRRASGAVLAKANISQVLDDAKMKCENAEERVLLAEQRVLELENEVEVLQKQKEALERQLGLL